jgi:hypothetical protein
MSDPGSSTRMVALGCLGVLPVKADVDTVRVGVDYQFH